MISISYIYILFSSFLTFMYCSFTYIIYILLIICSIYNYFNLYKITSKNKLVSILHHVIYSHMKDDSSRHLGFIIGNNFIGYIQDNSSNGCNAFILCNAEIFKNIISIKIEKNIEQSIKKDKITIYERDGGYSFLIYTKRTIDILELHENNKKQSNIVNSIKDFYDKNHIKVCISLIYGSPGSGKSICALLLTKLYKSSYVLSYNPTEPGDYLSSLYTYVNPTKESPLIILLDEIDTIYENITNDTIKKHDNVSTEIKDKRSYNTLFDQINLGFYPNIIIVMTSNLTFDLKNKIFHKYDSSFTREGRVHLYFKFELNENNDTIIDYCKKVD